MRITPNRGKERTPTSSERGGVALEPLPNGDGHLTPTGEARRPKPDHGALH
jgi:hypothetical protein